MTSSAWIFERDVATAFAPSFAPFAPAFEGGFRYPTRLLGIPLINFIAWLVFVFVYALQFRFIESRSAWTEQKKTLTLWGLMLLDWPILAFLLITPNL